MFFGVDGWEGNRVERTCKIKLNEILNQLTEYAKEYVDGVELVWNRIESETCKIAKKC